jgi:hypothetical protein
MLDIAASLDRPLEDDPYTHLYSIKKQADPLLSAIPQYYGEVPKNRRFSFGG